MDQNAVDWYEGMFLRPQHFQSHERFRHRQLRLHTECLIPYGWGFHSLELDTEALATGRLVIHRCIARFASGTILEIPESSTLNPIAVRPLIGPSSEVEICLALPHVNPVMESGVPIRYENREVLVPDEHDGTLAPIQMRRLKPVLLPKEQVSDGFESLPLARLRRSSQSAEGVELVPAFIPPLLSCLASSTLKLRIIESLFDTITRKLNAISPDFDTQSGSGLRRLFSDPIMVNRLGLLNQAYAKLSIISGTMQSHPIMVYRDLCEIVGKLAILGLTHNRQVGELPKYDHENLGPLFFNLKRRIEELVETLEEPGFMERQFSGVASRMQVRLDPQWLEPDWQLYIGIRSNLKPSDAVNLFSANGPMDFKISSSERVDQLYRMGQRGLYFSQVQEVPEVLGKISDTVFLTLGRNESANEWTYVRRNLNLSLRFNEGLLIGSIHDQTRLQLRFDGKPVEMELTLYVVPPSEQSNTNALKNPFSSGLRQEETGSGSA